MSRQEFKAQIVPMGEGGAWPCIEIPFSVEQTWGTKARLSVQGTINGFTFRSSIFPTGNGRHVLMVNKTMRTGARAETGDSVQVVIKPDTQPRTVMVPPDLKKALAKNKRAKEIFDDYSYSHKKKYVEWILEAKKPETRACRIEESIKRILGVRQ